ncbi:MAG TPA: nucleoside triphosphate pyrophosphohydrolase [Patescibacteria group bacterium]|nr:nucleoside triphosphate pyrophosphohydrolase [Patescibacteria group bacterium]
MGKKDKKLVRDRIREKVVADGKKPVTRVLDDKEYLQELIEKLREEVEEFAETPNVEELADIKEVMIALREALGIHAGELEDTRRKKAKTNGRFKERIYLESVE